MSADATYTVEALSQMRYAVVQFAGGPSGLPGSVPQVAKNAVRGHVGREAEDSTAAILIRHEDEPDPTGGAAEVLDHRGARDHVAQHADVWRRERG